MRSTLRATISQVRSKSTMSKSLTIPVHSDPGIGQVKYFAITGEIVKLLCLTSCNEKYRSFIGAWSGRFSSLVQEKSIDGKIVYRPFNISFEFSSPLMRHIVIW